MGWKGVITLCQPKMYICQSVRMQIYISETIRGLLKKYENISKFCKFIQLNQSSLFNIKPEFNRNFCSTVHF